MSSGLITKQRDIVMTPLDVVRETRRMVGWPYLYQGRNEFGVDCVGLLVLMGRALGMEVHDSRTYGRFPAAGDLLKFIRKNDAVLVRPKAMAVADLVVFNDARTHVGVVTDLYKPWSAIHARWDYGGVVERPLDLGRVRSVYRLGPILRAQLIAREGAAP